MSETAGYLLGNERFADAGVAISEERIRLAKRLAAQSWVGDERLIDQETFREKVAAVEVQLKAFELTQLRVVANASKKKVTQDPASSILKLRGSEIE
ncbi:alkylation response protein AidB-like acyl-CoA dehydrogenase [Bradyrhizobium sp. USDA 4354]